MKTQRDIIEGLDYFGMTCFNDISNKHVKIDGKLFFVKRVNDFADMCLYSVDENGNGENIANIFPCGKNAYFEIAFLHHGIHCRQRIKFISVEYAYGLAEKQSATWNKLMDKHRKTGKIFR